MTPPLDQIRELRIFSRNSPSLFLSAVGCPMQHVAASRGHLAPSPVMNKHLARHLFLFVLAKIGQGFSLREIGCCNHLFLHLLGFLRFTVAALLVTFGHFSFS
jgi:hypothetical protein